MLLFLQRGVTNRGLSSNSIRKKRVGETYFELRRKYKERQE